MGTSKGHGKYIETPERMWELFVDYKKEVKENPRIKYEFHGKDASKCAVEIEQPLTMEGFECYCMEHTKITYPDLTHYFENKDERYTDYVPVSTRIRKEIRQDQISGGMANIYNASLTARINGLKEHTQTNSTHNVSVINIDPLSEEN